MGVDLVLVGFRYSIIVLVFFITYVLLQPVATVVLRKVGPRIFLPAITILWGMVMICFGFVKNWTEMVVRSTGTLFPSSPTMLTHGDYRVCASSWVS